MNHYEAIEPILCQGGICKLCGALTLPFLTCADALASPLLCLCEEAEELEQDSIPGTPPSWTREELLSLGRFRGGSSERGDRRGGSSFSSHRRDGFLLRELLSTRICKHAHTHTESCFPYFWGHYIGLHCFSTLFYPSPLLSLPLFKNVFLRVSDF